MVDPGSLKMLKSIQLTEPSRGKAFGNVNEIRLLNAEDTFDRADGVDASSLRNSIDVGQNAVAIQCRRTWIRTVDRARRTFTAMLGK